MVGVSGSSPLSPTKFPYKTAAYERLFIGWHFSPYFLKSFFLLFPIAILAAANIAETNHRVIRFVMYILDPLYL